MTEPSTQQPQRARPLYWRALRLKHLRPSSWQRAVFFEGALVVAGVLVLADLASAWLLLALPLVVAAVVKANDILVGWLGATPHPVTAEESAAPDLDAAVTADDASPAGEAAGDEPESEPNVRVVNSPEPAAPKPRAARGRPGAAAARAQVSAAQGVRRRRAEPAPEQAKPSG